MDAAIRLSEASDDDVITGHSPAGTVHLHHVWPALDRQARNHNTVAEAAAPPCYGCKGLASLIIPVIDGGLRN